MRTLAFLTIPLGVAGLKSSLVYFITLVKLELLVHFSEVGLLGTGGGVTNKCRTIVLNQTQWWGLIVSNLWSLMLLTSRMCKLRTKVCFVLQRQIEFYHRYLHCLMFHLVDQN